MGCAATSYRVVPEEGNDVHPEDIHWHDDPPFTTATISHTGVDWVISTEESADYTAIVTGEVTWRGGNIEIYIQPHPIIRRMTFSETKCLAAPQPPDGRCRIPWAE
jgi:hypothetical protein